MPLPGHQPWGPTFKSTFLASVAIHEVKGNVLPMLGNCIWETMRPPQEKQPFIPAKARIQWPDIGPIVLDEATSCLPSEDSRTTGTLICRESGTGSNQLI